MKARRHSVADQTEPNAVQFGPSAGKSSDARFRSPTTKAPKPRKASAGEKSIHLWAASRPGHRQSHSLRQQSHPARFVAGGRNPLACIHTQREPVVPPAGTGTEYRRPQAVSWRLAALHTKASGDRSRIGGSTSISGTATDAIRWSNDLLVLQAVIGSCRTRTPLQKGTRAGESRGVREVCPAVGSSRRGRGKRGRQLAFGDRRRGLGAAGLPVAVSTGSVPLQSG